VDSCFFAAQGETGGFGLQALASADRFGQRFARAAATFFGASFVDLVGTLGGVGQNQHLVAGDLQEAPADRHRLFRTTLFDAHHAWQQGRQERRVARQDAHDTLGARGDHHIHGVLSKYFAFRGDDLYT
jgi:hypothetical protein